jgi:hypothetical protein
MLSVIMLSVVMLSIVVLSVVMLSVIMLSVVMLSVVAPFMADSVLFFTKTNKLECLSLTSLKSDVGE